MKLGQIERQSYFRINNISMDDYSAYLTEWFFKLGKELGVCGSSHFVIHSTRMAVLVFVLWFIVLFIPVYPYPDPI